MSEYNYEEFDKLVKMLDDAKIPYKLDNDDPDNDFYKRTDYAPVKRLLYGACPEKQVLYVCSVICGYGTYGGDSGLLEIMGLLTPEEEERGDVAGWLVAEDVFDRIKFHYDSSIKKNYSKLKEDMKTIKEAINDPNKDGFDVCRLIKSITDEYDFEEEKMDE